ncbi:sensor histidine kinase [Modestobacter sp. VKM Ac-2986]|uniref:sensor histidine kinase n=1 Tax=Modestobacter sp. VKM Ac-2986 TaxID=3004140 RepID=UPI0022AB3E40|nr:sensor histidine kinase [Modestobacter sp. VKM Ac-2986]MCZ2827261.1 sensor histidine kinase [Modestobacter sp. VKM Ac-2986]
MSVLGGHPPRWLQRARAGSAGAGAGALTAERTHGHTAAVVGSSAELLDVALPWLATGLADGDLTVLACDPETTDQLRDALGADGADLVSDPGIALHGTRPPDAVGALRLLVERAGECTTGRVRVLGMPSFGSAARDRHETQRFEAVLNLLFAGAPVDRLCVYDRRVLSPDAVASATATHPHLLAGGNVFTNRGYRRPETYVRSLPIPREPMEERPPAFAVDGARSLPHFRHQLRAALAAHVPDRERCQDLHLAVSEIAANAFRHGVPPVSARVWASADRVVCTITDRGTGAADELAGFQPAHGTDLSRGGMGLWLARKLWDHVDLVAAPTGLTVRLSTSLR